MKAFKFITEEDRERVYRKVDKAHPVFGSTCERECVLDTAIDETVKLIKKNAMKDAEAQ